MLANFWARHREVAGQPSNAIRGMPLGLPPLPPEQIRLVESWIDWDSGFFESFPLDGGEVICIDRLEFESLVSAYPIR